MKIGYLDCFSGISGDMLLGALVDAGVPLERIEAALDTLAISGYSLSERRVTRCGLAATQVSVKLDRSEHHPHRGLSDVLEIIESGQLAPEALEQSCAVFRNLARAEAHVHGTDPESVHFHEVGAVDAICDIVGGVVGLRELGLDALQFSTVSLGGGQVEAAHGTLPVPAPATAELLRDVPTRGGPVDVELTTPTGAALLSTLGQPVPRWPEMSVATLAYGAGARNLRALPNVLRLAVGVQSEEAESDCVWVLETNVDDMTGEEIGHCVEELIREGALDVSTMSIQMKKNRPGVQLRVICAPDSVRRLEEALWLHSTTLGVRRSLWQRSKLSRRIETAQTEWGQVRLKVALLGGRTMRAEPEYEDCREIARRNGLSIRQVGRAARAAWEGRGAEGAK
ncbi:MAG: nickel pincer cofactor biosynthesis protein LarC [Planctomycetes bacterium]|nr:nickel pincer cofactor biosynthesis protein LarC [Planctomycetota bacterium]